MFIAMNRFQVRKGCEMDFETNWRSRDSHLKGQKGFVAFHLLKGPEAEDHLLYASHTIWQSRDDFEAWTKSDAFRQAHKDAGKNSRLYLGGPRLEGFDVVQELKCVTE